MDSLVEATGESAEDNNVILCVRKQIREPRGQKWKVKLYLDAFRLLLFLQSSNALHEV